MATSPQAIQILTTLEYLGEYPKAGDTPHFGVVLQVGVGDLPNGTFDPTTADVQNILEPWMWQSREIQIWQTTQPSAANPIPVPTPIAATVTVLPVNNPAGQPYSLDSSITDQLSKDCKAAVGSPNELGWSDPKPDGSGTASARRDGQKILPWPAHLAQITRYAYPIPHLLNLSFFLKATGFDQTKIKDPNTYFFATVSFAARIGNATVDYAPPDASKLPALKNSRLVIPLVTADATDNSVAVTTQPLPFPLVPAASVVKNTGEYTAETADWQAHLSSSVASTFDLSARLVDTVRQACDKAAGPAPAPADTALRTAVAAEFTGFVTAVLTAQREIVAYGCRIGPSGKSLLDRLLDAWIVESKAPQYRSFAKLFSDTVKAQRDGDMASDANNVDSFDTWLALLKSRPAFVTDPVLPPTPAGATPTVFDKKKAGRAKTDPAYKKGDTVVFHGRSYIATSDVPAPPGDIDATHWRCLTPLLPFYVPNKLYRKGDLALSGDTVYQSIADPDASTPPPKPQKAPPSADWTSASSFTPWVDIANLPDRLIAVEHLQLQFTQPENLSQILLAQWTSIFNGNLATWPATGNAQFQSFLSSASANLAVWDVRGLLLQCHLDGGPTGSWTTITKKTATRVLLRNAIQDELNTRLVDGLLKKLPSAPGTAPDFTDQLKKQVGAWLTPRLQIMVPDLVPTAKPSPGAPAPSIPTAQPTRSAQGLSVMVGTLDANGAAGDDQSDPLRSIAGYCVLMRPLAAAKTPASPWRCLNAGIPLSTMTPPADPKKPIPAFHDPAKTVGLPDADKPFALPDPIVIPLPMHNQDGLRRAILTYDNQPLMCASPAHAFGDGLVPAPKRDASRNFDRMISFEHLSVRTELANGNASLEKWKIPGLAFKQSYEFLLGAISNSGALPPEFADPNNPGLFSFDTLKKKDRTPTITKVPYLRTVPVGDLRFASDYYPTLQTNAPSLPPPDKAGTFDKLRIPPIPDDVQPRANEVYASSLAPVNAIAVGTTPSKPSKPLIVLSPYQTRDNKSYAEFDLWIGKPTTDFLTWDRTQASTPGSHQGRQWAWQLFNINARKQNSNFDLSLDDPAIDSLTLSVKDSSGAAVTVAGLTTLQWPNAEIQNPATATALQMRSQPILLRIATKADTSTSPKASLTGSVAVDVHSPPTFTLTLPQGFLGSVSLQPNLKRGADQQFAPGISSAPSSYELLVETASTAFPQQIALKNALSIQPPVTAADPVKFTLALAPQTDAAWKQVSRVDLQAQLWRWDGRPARSFPFEKVVPVGQTQLAADLLPWELETFATRTASDSTTRPMVRQSNNFVANEDRSTELGATFYRAGITAYNRYGSLVPETMPVAGEPTLQVRSANSLNSFASIPGADGDWVRRFIPGRYTLDGSKPTTYKPPKPAIKYIVPLTAAFGASQQAASSVLVVVQGPWFAIAGLAEDISVEIVDVDPKTHPDGNNWKEAGPDPIYYKSSSDLPKSYDSYRSPFTEPDARNPLFHGPVGHTFDSSDTNPLWVTSSFVLDPPKEYSDDAKKSPISATQEGTFAQIQFRRTIQTAGMAVADANRKLVPDTPDPNPPYPYPNRSSDPTDPVWVQFLPSHFLPTGPSQDFDTLVVKPDKTTVGIFDQTGSLIQLTHNLNSESTKPSEYRFALLLTENVPDLLGRRGQERYVDMLLQAPKANPTAQWTYDPKKSKVNPDRNLQTLIARIVVIQRQVNTSTLCSRPLVAVPCPYSDIADADALWQEMFPPDAAQDAISRIVAVSPPIPAYNAAVLPLSCITDSTTFDTQTAPGHGD